MLKENQSVAELVRKMEEDDDQGNTHISKYVDFYMRETIDKIEAYSNSKHISGDTDAMGREKPFFNIVTSAVNIWYRATDIDRKDIKLRAIKQRDYTLAYILTMLLEDAMRKNNFGAFLNDWGKKLAKYGSCVSKHVEVDKELINKAMDWNTIIVDPVDFWNNLVIEKLWYTPAQLIKEAERKGYDMDMVDELLDMKQARENSDGQNIDNKADYILLYEVHGELPLSYITEKDSDDKEYTQQMHVISYLVRNDGNKSKYEEYTLYKGREKQSPYYLTHLIEEDGRTLSIGAVENLFEAQWMANDNVKKIKDQLDLASKLVFQTADPNFVGQNVLNAIENGEILTHGVNMPITQVQNNSHDISALQAFGQQWTQQGMQINGINEAMTSAPKAGTAWRQTQAALQEAHSLFELMTENKGLALENIIREFFLPFMLKQMNTSDEITALLDENNIKKLDTMYLPSEASKRVNKRIVDDILNKTPQDLQEGNIFTPEMQQEQVANEQEAMQKSLKQMGNQRFIKPSEIDSKTWKEVAKDFEWDVDIDITGENKDTQAVLATLTTVMQTIAGLGGQPMPEEMKPIFNKILNLTGALSPMEMIETTEAPQTQQTQPQQAQPPQV